MNPRLVTIAGPLSGETFCLSREEYVIGRDASVDLCIEGTSVSRRHCRIQKTGVEFAIIDLDSLNGTFINGIPVKDRILLHGDRIKIGDLLFLFLIDESETRQAPETIHWDEDEPGGVTVQLRREESLYLQPEKMLATLPPTARLARNLTALLKISRIINSLHEQEELSQHLLGFISEIVPVKQGAILMVEGDIDDPASIVVLSKLSSSDSLIPLSRTVIRRVLREGISILSNDIQGTQSLKNAPSLVEAQIRSILAVPLIIYEKVIGVIYLYSRDPGMRFDDDDLQILNAIANMAAVSLENARRFECLENENQRLHVEINLEHNLVGDSQPIREVLQSTAKVAPTDATVLILGESGTGKELVARAIHLNSSRRAKPFLAINCAALTETLLESELFGYEKGAFTGALFQKKGKLEFADGGTIFLDEVGELTPLIQAKLLRVLQEREFERVGGTQPIRVDIRLIAATNKNLEEAVREKTFRQDLYFRLNVVSLTMPPLRERREDIPLLASYFADKYSKKSHRRITGISHQARALLMHYEWPGNIRELENAIERAVVLGSSELILPEDLPEPLLEAASSPGVALTRFHEVINKTKKQLIVKTFESASGSYTETARMLGLHPNYLHRLIRNLDLKMALKQKVGGHQSSLRGSL